MDLIDSHVHLWDLTRFRYPWLDHPEFASLRADYLVSDFMADVGELPLTAVVHVQAEVDHKLDPVTETSWLASLVDNNPELPGMVCVGYADLRTPALADTLDRHAEHDLFRGIRQEAWFDPQSTRADIPRDDLLSDPAWCAGLRELGKRGLSFDLLIWSRQLVQAAEIFRAHPDVPVVLEHLGTPILEGGSLPPGWREGIRRFATDVPHSVVKLSALSFLGSGWTTDIAAPVIREVIDVFAPSRCMFGSNFPVERANASYGGLWHTFAEIVAELSTTERESLFHGTAQRTYRIERQSRPREVAP